MKMAARTIGNCGFAIRTVTQWSWPAHTARRMGTGNRGRKGRLLAGDIHFPVGNPKAVVVTVTPLFSSSAFTSESHDSSMGSNGTRIFSSSHTKIRDL